MMEKGDEADGWSLESGETLHRWSNFESNLLFYLPVCIQESVGNPDDECPHTLITKSPKSLSPCPSGRLAFIPPV